MEKPEEGRQTVSGILSDPRRRILVILAAALLGVAAIGLVSARPDDAEATRDEVGQLVVPGLDQRIDELGLIMVTTAYETYHLVRDPQGWVMTEKGGYPVADDRIGALVEAVASMRYAEAMTRDARKFDLIGVGDPLSGGTGALLEIGNGRGDVYAKLIVGYRSGRSYVRWPDDLQTWAVETDAAMPPLQRTTAWLDLDPVDADRARISEVEVSPLLGEAYRLTPVDSEGQAFELAAPHTDLRVLVPFALSMVGGAISTLSPLDVAPASVTNGASLGGRHVTRLDDGVMVETTAFRTADRGWITISAFADGTASSAARRRAREIDDAAAGWAYALSATDWEAFTSPLAMLAVED